MWDRQSPNDCNARTDNEIEQLADLSLEAKTFGHFGSIDLKEHGTEMGGGVWRVASGEWRGV